MHRGLGVLCLGVSFFASPGFAQVATNRASRVESVLPDMVVTASRTARDVRATPCVVHRLEAAAEAARRGARTTPELLDGLPSVMVQKTAYGQGSPYLRGFTGFRTLCLLDGVRLNNSVFRDGPNQYWNTVDPLSVDHCEAVMGPASVLYGSDAIGGTLNAFGVRPPAWHGEPAWEPRLYYRGATAEDSHTGRIQIGARPTESIGVVGGFSLKGFGDLRGGHDVGVQEHTRYGEWDGDLRADLNLGRAGTVTLAHQNVDQDDAWRTHSTRYGISWEGLAAGDDKVRSYDQNRDLTYLKYRVTDVAAALDAVEITLSRHVQQEDYLRVRKDDRVDRQGTDVTTWGAVLQVESDPGWAAWVAGAEFYHDAVDSYGRRYRADGSLQSVEIQGPVADDASYESLGAFVQATVPLFGGRLDVVPGARYTLCRADADRVLDPLTGNRTRLDDQWDAVVGSLRLLCPLTADRRHTVFAGVAQGFRAPNLSDLTRLDTARSSELETPSPDLDPERYVTGEVGVRSQAGGLSCQAACYYTQIDGMIVRTPTGREVDGSAEVTKKNSGDGYIEGAEFSARYAFDAHWSAWMAGTWMLGEVDAYPTSDAQPKRDYVSRLMPPTLEVGVRLQTGDGRHWCELTGNMAAKAGRLSADDERDTQRIPPGGTPGYAVFHARAGFSPLDHLDVTLALENLLDEDYRIHGSGVNEPGRNLILTTSYAF